MAEFRHNPVWPGPEQRDLIRAALLDGNEAATAFQRWRERVIFDDIDSGSARLVPLVLWNLRRIGVRDPLFPRMTSVSRYQFAATTIRLEALRRFVIVLTEAKIPALLMKGAAVGQRYYPSPALRPMQDGDVLIPHALTRKALQRLVAAGWRMREKAQAHHHRAMFHLDVRNQMTELHFLSWQDATVAEDRAAWKRAEPLVFREMPCWTFCPEDEIVLACRHGVNWAPVSPLRWLVDCALIVRSRAGALDWEQLAKSACAAEATLAVRRSLEWLRREISPTLVPREALQKLREHRTTRRERRIFAVRTKPKVWREQAWLYAKYLERTLPMWLWLLRPRRVLHYFGAQFNLPDHRDSLRFILCNLRLDAERRGLEWRETLYAKLALLLGCRKVTVTQLRHDLHGAIEDPTLFCWAKRRLELVGFCFTNDGAPQRPMRITGDARVLDLFRCKQPAVHVGREHPNRPNALFSGFTALTEFSPDDCEFFIEMKMDEGWHRIFAVHLTHEPA